MDDLLLFDSLHVFQSYQADERVILNGTTITVKILSLGTDRSVKIVQPQNRLLQQGAD